jgi:gluconate kinase
MTKKTVFVLMGRTAAGKTTSARNIAEHLGYEYISCALYKRKAKSNCVAAYDKADSLNDKYRDEGLVLAMNATIESLDSKDGIVIDSSFGSKKRRNYLIERLSKHVEDLFYVYCLTSDIEKTKSRIESRKGREHIDIKYHASDFNVFKHIDESFEEPDGAELDCITGNKNIFYIDTFKKKISSLYTLCKDDDVCVFNIVKKNAIINN